MRKKKVGRKKGLSLDKSFIVYFCEFHKGVFKTPAMLVTRKGRPCISCGCHKLKVADRPIPTD